MSGAVSIIVSQISPVALPAPVAQHCVFGSIQEDAGAVVISLVAVASPLERKGK